MKHSRFGLSGISFGIAAYGHGQYTESAGNERRGSAGSSEEGERGWGGDLDHCGSVRLRHDLRGLLLPLVYSVT